MVSCMEHNLTSRDYPQTKPQGPITSRFDARNDIGVVRNYGKLLIEMTRTVPDGIIVFFTSYTYLENIVEAWSVAPVAQSRVLGGS